MCRKMRRFKVGPDVDFVIGCAQVTEQVQLLLMIQKPAKNDLDYCQCNLPMSHPARPLVGLS